MTRSNLLWGLGGAIVGAITTYFVMEYIYDKEMAEFYGEEDIVEDSPEDDKKRVVDIADAEMYTPDQTRFNPDANDGQDEFDPFLHVVSEEEHMEEDEAIVMEAIFLHEQEESEEDEDEHFIADEDENEDDGSLQEEEMDEANSEENEDDGSLQEDEEEMDEADSDQEDDEDMPSIDTQNGIYMIDVAEVSPGRRIVARFDHDTCNIEISTVMSVKTTMFDEVIEELFIEELLGFEAYNTLMNAEPSKKERMIAVRNNLINLDFAISY